MGGGLLVFKRGGREKNVGREDIQGGEDWGGGDNGACVWGGGYGGAGSYVREELIFILFIHPLNFCGLDA